MDGVVITTPPLVRLKLIQMACKRGITLIDAAIKNGNTEKFIQVEEL